MVQLQKKTEMLNISDNEHLSTNIPRARALSTFTRWSSLNTLPQSRQLITAAHALFILETHIARRPPFAPTNEALASQSDSMNKKTSLSMTKVGKSYDRMAAQSRL